jgi:hypothetical protein
MLLNRRAYSCSANVGVGVATGPDEHADTTSKTKPTNPRTGILMSSTVVVRWMKSQAPTATAISKV